jgi:TRAP transporter TAXI family solute receptor
MSDEPQESLRDQQIDAAFAAYLRSCDAGKHSQREEFLAQFPELEPDLRRLIATADLLQRFTDSSGEKQTPSKVAHDADTVGASFTGNQASRPAAFGLAGPRGSNDQPPANGADGEATQLVNSTGSPVASAASMVSRGRGVASVGTEGGRPDDGNFDDPNSTLPADDRPADHPGPRLPFMLGDYELQKMIGRGGMGVVYLATQRDLDRQVAVKMIRSGMLAGEDEVRRFRTEARAAAKLQHPNIVTVHHFGYLQGHHYFSMDYVDGTDLSRKLEHGPLPIMLAARYVRDCAKAIHTAHQCGILHRDLKPANVLIDRDDSVRITDFGLAKQIDADSSLTASGTAVGTPNYMAPEQANGMGDRAGREADVYALGAILFALVTGRPPFVGGTIVQTLMQVVHRPAPSPREFRPDIPAELETVLMKCLEKDPQARYRSADELASELDRVLQGRPVLAKRRSPLHRLWIWFLDIPIVAAVTGRRFLEASETHRRVQTAILALTLFLPILLFAFVAFNRWQQGRMPRYVRIAGGIEGGVYDEVSGEIAYRITRSQGVDATVVSSGGSVENRRRLLDEEIDLAPMQASAIRGDNLCVVAPLFYEVVHVLVRPEAEIKSLNDLKGHRVAVGPEGSGSRLAADLLFDSFQLSKDDVSCIVASWQDPTAVAGVDAAIICIGTGSRVVDDMLENQQFVLLSIPESFKVSFEHPTLRPLQIPATAYPDRGLSEQGYDTVGMTAFLAARMDTPNVLVEAALQAIYAEPPLYANMIPLRGAAEFQGMQLHPAARRFFDR